MRTDRLRTGPRSGPGFLAALGVLTAFLFQAIPHRTAELAAGNGPELFPDSDGDGLSDDFELYLNTASTVLSKTANPFNGDSDGDNQPDGFEYCLTAGRSVYSPGVVQPLVPALTLGCMQSGKDLLVSMYMIPGNLDLVDAFVAKIAYKGPQGLVMLDFTSALLASIESVGFDSYNGQLMAVYQFRVPTQLIMAVGGLALAVGGRLAGVPVGDNLTLSGTAGLFFRWEYYPTAGANAFFGEAQPLLALSSGSAEANEVCGSSDRREPTGTPGLLKSVVLATGCTSGEWACPAGVCTMSGVGQDKPVIDIFSLISPGG